MGFFNLLIGPNAIERLNVDCINTMIGEKIEGGSFPKLEPKKGGLTSS